jgi:hypothetical protein
MYLHKILDTTTKKERKNIKMKKILKIITLSIISCCLVFILSACQRKQHESKQDKSITISLMNYNDYIDYIDIKAGPLMGSDVPSEVSTLKYSKILSTVNVKLNEQYQIVEPITISYKATIYYGYNKYNFTTSVDTTGKIVLSKGFTAKDSQEISLSKSKYLVLTSGFKGLPTGKIDIISISGKIERIVKQ